MDLRSQGDRQISVYWESLTPDQQVELDAAARAQADPDTLKLESGPMKRLGQRVRREAYRRPAMTNALPSLGVLTPGQRRFVEAYFDREAPTWLCATRAAKAAGYAWPDKQGPRLLTMPRVAAIIEARFRTIAKSTNHACNRPSG